MIVRKCDRKGCNKFYEQYGNSNSDSVEPNGTLLIFKNITGLYSPNRAYDLCPECLEKLKEFLGGEESSETNTD